MATWLLLKCVVAAAAALLLLPLLALLLLVLLVVLLLFLLLLLFVSCHLLSLGVNLVLYWVLVFTLSRSRSHIETDVPLGEHTS